MSVPAFALPAGGDRAESWRDRPGLVAELRSRSDTRVIVVRGDAVAVRGDALCLVAVDAVEDAVWAFLGRTAEGFPLLLAVRAEEAGAPEGAEWAPLRIVGGELPEQDAAWAVTAVSLGRWLVDAGFCPACGAPAALAQAGWSRRCTSCGRQHFPRTDPAVIVAVVDAADERILLGSNAAWPAGRYSCFAGFVEAGESLESAVVREVEEEAGVRVGEPAYRGSQAWPYPRSLMLGFRAVAGEPGTAHADGEEIAEVRWLTRAQIGEALAGNGEVTLPGSASIARRLIAEWHGERA